MAFDMFGSVSSWRMTYIGHRLALVVEPPLCLLALALSRDKNQRAIQTHLPEASIERFDEGVVDRSAGSVEV
jgi:hypothetical protein